MSSCATSRCQLWLCSFFLGFSFSLALNASPKCDFKVNKVNLNLDHLKESIQSCLLDLDHCSKSSQPQTKFGSHCHDVALKGHRNNGVYNVTIAPGKTIEAYCELEADNENWTVIQRRTDGKVDFDLDWRDYVQGFGIKSGEHWLGLENIHLMTSSRPHKLQIDLHHWEGDITHKKYAFFSVGNYSTNYTMKVSGFLGNESDNSLKINNGKAFSTRDNEQSPKSNCLRETLGAWWHADTCTKANLNGVYREVGQDYGTQIYWDRWKHTYTPLKKVTMKIRPVMESNDKAVYCDDVNSTYDEYDGVYELQINSLKSIVVNCKLESDGKKWMVIQRRFDGSVDFYRNWTEYVEGFGNLSGEHWLGLEDIHLLTESVHHELQIDIEDWSGRNANANYKSFYVDDASSSYKLKIDDFSGTTEDWLKDSDGQSFSTKDRGNDLSKKKNCARDFNQGGWWYKFCTRANLNGRYFNGDHLKSSRVYWAPKDYFRSITKVVMKISPTH